jgi:hypothetical protein
VTQLLDVLQRQAAGVLHDIPATYEEITRELEGRYGDHHLTWAYLFQLDARTQLSSESLLALRRPSSLLAYRAFVELPQRFIHKKATYTFIEELSAPSSWGTAGCWTSL